MNLKIVVLLFLASVCSGQTHQYVVQEWNVEDGLPQSTVRCIAQTHDGYLWVGTWNGLARFDGVRMSIFKSGNTPALYTSNIMSLFSDNRGQLWIGTDAGGLVRYAKGQFNRFDSTNGISATRILDINEDHSGNMWFATEKGIYVFDGNKFLHFTEANGLINTYANQVLPFPDKNGDRAMYLGFVGFGSRVHLSDDSLVIENVFPVGGYTLSIDTVGTLWFGFRGKGFIRRVDEKEFIDKTFANVNPKETYITRNGDKWLLTPTDIRIISNSNETILQKQDNVSFSEITTVFEDRDGNIWLGKEGGGLICLRNKQIEVLSLQNGFPSDFVLCGLESRTHAVWIGTWESGLLCRSNHSLQQFSTAQLSNTTSSIYTLCEDHDGTIWAGTWGSGLYSLHNTKVEHFSRGIIQQSTSIISVVEDKNGGLWIGTAHDGVAYVKGKEENTWNTSKGLSSDRINAILAAQNGDVWISASANGVNRISNGMLTVFKKGSGLNDNFASPMYEDHDSAIWIGTNHGLNRFKNGMFTYVTERQGLFDDAIAQIIEDDIGNFWIGAVHGIYRVRKQELNDAADGIKEFVQCFTIGKEDGMLNEETGGGGTPRCWKTSDGKLWFSTARGVVIIDPRTVASNSALPSVTIEDVWIENDSVPLQPEITLRPGQTKLELQYTGLNFAAPKKIRFKYLLEGFDKDWNDAGTQRLVQYTNLDAGQYKFRVKAQNNAGVWNEQEASLQIVVLPRFYATWWFRTLILIIVLTLGPAIYIIRVKKLKREKEKQIEFSRLLIESQESERKRIATELHDGLGQNLLIIKNKLLVALQTLNKDISTNRQVEEASDIVTNTIEEVRSISHNLRPHQLDQLGITKTLRSIVRQANEATPIKFSAEIQDIDGTLSSQEEINLFRIVQESFNNIIKHSDATKAEVKVLKEREAIHVIISDNGKGILSSPGFGVSGMQERAKMFGWEFSQHSDSGAHIVLLIRFKK